MKKYLLSVTNHTPLSIKQNFAADDPGSLDYISGSALQGAVTNAAAVLDPDNNELLKTLINNVSFGYLYPSNRDQAGFPLPRTALSCKRYPGFKQNANEHGVYDSLYGWALFQAGDQKDMSSFDKLLKCPECQNRLDPFSGYYSIENKQPFRITLDKHIATRTGIDRSTGCVADAILYNREYIEAGHFFSGYCVVPDNFSEQFETLLKKAFEQDLIRTGNNRTRGMGLLHLSSLSLVQNSDPNQLESNSNKLAQRCNSKPGSVFSVTLHSPLVLTHPTGGNSLKLTAKHIEAATGLTNLTLTVSYSSREYLMRWDTPAGLPNFRVDAISAGSVFLYQATEPLSADNWKKLAELQTEGLGSYRQQGLGMISINDVFHTTN